MQIPILQTRLNPPVLPDDLIMRPNLMEKLNKGTKHKLTLLSAPAGYGKTTLAGQWLQMQERPFVWLSIDQTHMDSRIFMQYILSALGKKYDVFNNSFWQISQLQAEWEPLYIVGHLINKIIESEIDFLLVLDDYHLIDSKETNEILRFLLENLPPGINVIITSRTDPNLPLAKMRAKQELEEINLRDLQFNIGETERLLGELPLCPFTEEKIHQIYVESEGWITGIQMALLAHNRNSPDPVKFVRDYLFEEVLSREDSQLVSFLYDTSILSYLNASLCDALRPGRERSSEEILSELLKKNLFIKEVDNDGGWFRLHPLFQEILIEKRVGEVADLHIAAAQWFWEKGQHRESFHHFLSSGNFSLTVSYLEKCWPIMEQNFNFQPWLKWVDSLPESEKIKHPLLLSQIAWALLDLGQLNQCEVLLNKLGKLLDPLKGDKTILILIASAWSYLSFIRRDLRKTIEYAEKMESLDNEENSFNLIQARSYQALARWLMGDLDYAYRSFENFRDEMIAFEVPAYALSSYLALTQIRMQQGRISEVQKLLDEALGFENGPEQIIDKVKASLHLRAASLDFEKGNRESMEEHLLICGKYSRIDSLIDFHYQWHQFRALVFESDDKWDKALNELDDAEHLFIQTPALDDLSIEEQKTRIWIRMKKKTTARKALRTLFSAVDLIPSFQNESKIIIKIRFTLTFYEDSEELEHALELSNQLSAKARSEGRHRNLAEILILSTCLLHKLKRKDDALDAFRQGLSFLEDTGFVQVFLLERDNLKSFLREYSSRLMTIDAYQHLRDALEEHEQRKQVLSPRELEVLRLIAIGDSNKKIGEKLFVAESTIKGHNQRIFQKLNVEKRTEAISEGRKLGLIE